MAGGRYVSYATSSPPLGPTPKAIVFLPLGVSRFFVTTEEVRESARSANLCLIAVDRPGVGGTSPAARREKTPGDPAHFSTTVRARIRAHSEDAAAVLASLGARRAKVVAICAGTAYALHFVRHFTALVDTAALTLVTPWVSPECPHSWGLAKVAADRWFFGRTWAGYLFGSMQLSFTVPMLTSLSPDQALDVLENKFTPTERRAVERARRKRFEHASAANRTGWEGRGEDDCSEEDLRDCQRFLIGEKALTSISCNADAHTVNTIQDDVRVCLSGIEELELDDMHSLKVGRTLILGADKDEIVKPAALHWLVDRLPNAELLLFRDASHGGVQVVRRDIWLRLAATDGRRWPPGSLLVDPPDILSKVGHDAYLDSFEEEDGADAEEDLVEDQDGEEAAADVVD